MARFLLSTRVLFSRNALLVLAVLAAAGPHVVHAQTENFDLPPIEYASSQPANALTRLQERIDAGTAQLSYEKQDGYLRSILRELKIPESSQALVFSKTSLQARRISPSSPRAIYFNDEVYVGFCQAGDFLEFSVADPTLGAVFYTLDQFATDKPKLNRETESCLRCHGSSATRGFPGHLVRSIYPDSQGSTILSAGWNLIDHTSPVETRWGGWYVTGTHGEQRHLGNIVFADRESAENIQFGPGLNQRDLPKKVNAKRYLTPHSDLVALMVMEHQTQGHNLITRANFITRKALHYEAEMTKALNAAPGEFAESRNARIKDAGDPLVDYLLFKNEAALTAPIRGTSSFATDFPAIGPRDAKGRSLRDFDLNQRMYRHPCSYLVYSEAFNQLPEPVRAYVWQRLWGVLHGEHAQEFAHLTVDDREAILEILIETHPNLPDYWKKAA